jgi:hypothetical protein
MRVTWGVATVIHAGCAVLFLCWVPVSVHVCLCSSKHCNSAASAVAGTVAAVCIKRGIMLFMISLLAQHTSHMTTSHITRLTSHVTCYTLHPLKTPIGGTRVASVHDSEFGSDYDPLLCCPQPASCDWYNFLHLVCIHQTVVII